MFPNFTDVKLRCPWKVSMRHISLPLSNGLMTRSGSEPTSLRVDLCCKVRLGFVTCGEGYRESFGSVQETVLVWWSLVQREGSKCRAYSMWGV